MENKKYKILVLSDLKDTTQTTLKNTIGLAKMIGGDVEFFHVTKPTEVVNSESQLSAMRNINEQYINTDKRIKQILEPLLLEYKVDIKYKYAFGNVKSEIEKRIDKLKPDLVVVGKRKSRSINLMGDKITDYVIKHYNGVVIIASKDEIIDEDNQLSIGTFNNFEDSLDIDLVKSLLSKTKTPLKTFVIADSTIGAKTAESNQNKVKYVFEDNANVMNTLSGYVSKNKINLFCMLRNQNDQKQASYAKSLIDKMGVSLLVA